MIPPWRGRALRRLAKAPADRRAAAHAPGDGLPPPLSRPALLHPLKGYNPGRQPNFSYHRMPSPQPRHVSPCRPIASIGPVARVRAALGARHTPPLAPASGPRAVLGPAVRDAVGNR